MTTLDEQIKYIERRLRTQEDIVESDKGGTQNWITEIHNEEIQMLSSIKSSLMLLKSNGKALHSETCLGCGQKFIPKNKAQNCCSTKCRVRYHRMRHKMEEVNEKLKGIIPGDFVLQQTIQTGNDCGFVVIIPGGKEIGGKTVKQLLNNCKKHEA